MLFERVSGLGRAFNGVYRSLRVSCRWLAKTVATRGAFYEDEDSLKVSARLLFQSFLYAEHCFFSRRSLVPL